LSGGITQVTTTLSRPTTRQERSCNGAAHRACFFGADQRQSRAAFVTAASSDRRRRSPHRLSPSPPGGLSWRISTAASGVARKRDALPPAERTAPLFDSDDVPRTSAHASAACDTEGNRQAAREACVADDDRRPTSVLTNARLDGPTAPAGVATTGRMVRLGHDGARDNLAHRRWHRSRGERERREVLRSRTRFMVRVRGEDLTMEWR
jgi:hypothetical protein